MHRWLTLPGVAAAFVVTPDQREALVGTADGAIHRVLLPTLEIKRSQRVLDPRSCGRMAISPEGSLLAVTTQNDARVMLLDPRTLEPLAKMPGLDCENACPLGVRPRRQAPCIRRKMRNVMLWDLALVRDVLAAVGLAWDQLTPSAATAETFGPEVERAKPQVPVIRPGNADPTVSRALPSAPAPVPPPSATDALDRSIALQPENPGARSAAMYSLISPPAGRMISWQRARSSGSDAGV